MKEKFNKIQVPPKHYFKNYDTFLKWINYWYQLDVIKNLRGKEILEIGIGNKTVTTCLLNKGYNVITLDIDKRLKPDRIGDILNIPFGNNKFDIILCCEVLEHIPFEKFELALRELYRTTKKYVILSLPQCRLSFSLMIKLSLIKYSGFIFDIPFPIKHKFDGEHYWELGKKGYSYNKIRYLIKKANFKINLEFTPILDNYHHFYVLEKINDKDYMETK